MTGRNYDFRRHPHISGGNLRAASSITVSPGATLSLGETNLFTSDHGTAENAAFHVTLNGGAWVSTAGESHIGNVNLNSGATWSINMTQTDWGNCTLGALSDASQPVITVGGSRPRSSMASATSTRGANTAFNVGEATGNSAVDLTVSARLEDQASTFGTGGLAETGLGTMHLSQAGNSYSGATAINQGLLIVSGGTALATPPM